MRLHVNDSCYSVKPSVIGRMHEWTCREDRDTDISACGESKNIGMERNERGRRIFEIRGLCGKSRQEVGTEIERELRSEAGEGGTQTGKI